MAAARAAFGMHAGRSGAADLAPGAADLEALRLPAGRTIVAWIVVATPAERAAARDALSVHLALAPETQGTGERRRCCRG